MGEFEDKLLKERYCIGNESSWKDVVERVMNAIATDAKEQKMFYDLMINKDFIPNSPTLMNAGTDNGQLSACFVLPVNDSIDSIFTAVKNAALVHKTGGGTGFSFTALRPSGSVVKSTSGVASGVVSFMQVFDAATDAIKQGGKRRGANMGVLEYTHPEILNFIKCKTVEGTIKNFNISVMVDDIFMNEILDLDKRGLGNKNSDILNAIVDGIYNNGEPGILFKDTINKFNPTPQLGDMVATNPCGEQPLLPNESCNLGSINLSNFVTASGIIDYNRLEPVVRDAVVFLDNVITANKYPLEAIKEASNATRKIGLGVMGFHDMLIKMGIPYDSKEAIEIADSVMGFISQIADRQSMVLAISRGFYPALNAKEGYRNATRTTIAPTGTISILANVSSGIEPVFSWAYKRKDTLGEHIIINPLFEAALWDATMEDQVLHDEVIAHVMEKGTIQDVVGLCKEFKALFKSALDISPLTHVKMQAAFQKHTDNAVSKTINLKPNATKDDIKAVIIEAWKLGCKGLTIYRSGSRETEVLCLTKQESPKQQMITTPINGDGIIDWVEDEFYEAVIPAYIYKVRSGCGSFYVIVGHDGEAPTKVFVEGAGNGGCAASMAGLGRSISTGLDYGTPAENYVRQFSRVKCNTAMTSKTSGGKSCSDIIGKSINNVINRLNCINELNCTTPPTFIPAASNKTLPESKKACCDNPKYALQEGCQVCLNCGASKCS
ncbi:MAG: adenosylcobalamin-dependent ribonucleoside-diphosphate reductase [Candidatus Babeliales bacterium]|jgi:ribonucleoside-diphosphate reductase alpha chain